MEAVSDPVNTQHCERPEKTDCKYQKSLIRFLQCNMKMTTGEGDRNGKKQSRNGICVTVSEML